VYWYTDTLLGGIKRYGPARRRRWLDPRLDRVPDQPHDLFHSPRTVTFGDLAAFDVDRGIEDKLWGHPRPGG
jgi:hypothetical protein